MLRCSAVFLLIVALFGCNVATDPVEVSPHSGTFALESVNGAPLPWIIELEDGTTTEILAGVITLFDDWTFVDYISFRRRQPSGVSDSSSFHEGNYEVNGEVITLSSANVIDASFVDETIVIPGGGNSAIYRRIE